jgi:hypothetical protein
VQPHQQVAGAVELGETELVGGWRGTARPGIGAGFVDVEAPLAVEQLCLHILDGRVQQGLLCFAVDGRSIELLAEVCDHDDELVEGFSEHPLGDGCLVLRMPGVVRNGG